MTGYTFLSWDQPNLNPWFSDKSNHDKYDWYVFNSNWNFEQFTKRFDLPREKCVASHDQQLVMWM